MRMTRLVSVARRRLPRGSPPGYEQSASCRVVAHASAAISRSGNRPLRLALDTFTCPQGLLGHGPHPRGLSRFSRHLHVVPSLGVQLEEYASGKFNEPWFELAFRDAEQLTREEKGEILQRAFQVNHERLLTRWPRFLELYEWSRAAGGAQAQVTFTPRDWRDLQLLSQLAWMDEEWIARDPVINALSSKGKDFSEKDKAALKKKQFEYLRIILPIYREAAARGQIEISTTPFYHPILPLICDSDIARVANPSTPLPRRAYRHPEDAREQLRRAREYHERVFGVKPAGLWPSEGSVSDETLRIAAEEVSSGSAPTKASLGAP